MLKKLLLVVSVVYFSGCSNDNLYEKLSEQAIEPLVATPTVDSFDSLSGISIRWKDDSNASEYVVYRQIVSGSAMVEVYRGKNKEYFDSLANGDSLYYYFLSKVRGQKEFPKSQPVLGCFNSVHLRNTQAGDSADNPQVFLNQATDRVFYYPEIVDGREIVVEDRDWYYYDLNARSKLIITISYLDQSQMQYLRLYTDEDKVVVHNAEYAISNSSYQKSRMLFNLRFNAAQITHSKIIIPYRINFVRTENLITN